MEGFVLCVSARASQKTPTQAEPPFRAAQVQVKLPALVRQIGSSRRLMPSARLTVNALRSFVCLPPLLYLGDLAKFTLEQLAR